MVWKIALDIERLELVKQATIIAWQLAELALVYAVGSVFSMLAERSMFNQGYAGIDFSMMVAIYCPFQFLWAGVCNIFNSPRYLKIVDLRVIVSLFMLAVLQLDKVAQWSFSVVEVDYDGSIWGLKTVEVFKTTYGAVYNVNDFRLAFQERTLEIIKGDEGVEYLDENNDTLFENVDFMENSKLDMNDAAEFAMESVLNASLLNQWQDNHDNLNTFNIASFQKYMN